MTPSEMVALADVCEINPRLPKGHPLSDDTNVSFVPMAAVDETDGAIGVRRVRPFSEVKKGYTSFRDNDVLFAKITPCMENGKAAVARDLQGSYGFGSTEFHVLRATSRVLAEWIFYFVRREQFRAEAKRSFTGTAGQQRVPASFLHSVQIPVPPLPQQHRLVDILSRAESIVRLRREAQKKAAELIPALFLDTFGDPATNLKGWPVLTLGELVEEFRYGTSQKSGPSGLPVLRIPNVIGDRLELSDMKLVDIPDAEANRLRLSDGDVLFVRTNGNTDYVGRSAVFTRKIMEFAGFDGANTMYASYLIRARLCREGVEPTFLQAYLSSIHGRRVLKERCRTSAGQFNINTAGLSSIPVPVPPKPLQIAFVRHSQNVSALRDQQSTATTQAEATFNALLAHSISISTMQ